MRWQGTPVLVTGAGGFIGSHLAERLVKIGARTRAMIRYNALGTRGWLDDSDRLSEMEVFAGDLRDRDSVRAAVRDVDVVFHLGALIAIPYSYEAPASYVTTNVHGTLNVLQAAREEGVGRIVHTSTSEVYGTAQYVPIDEDHPIVAQSPYAASKVGADKLAESFHLAYDLPVTTVRPFNTFGPRQSARAVIPTIITQALAGTPIRLGNTSPTRDLNYVSNTVDGFLAAAESDAAVGRTLNLGSGREISIGDLARLIGQIVGSAPRIETDPERVRPEGSEVERLLADASRAREMLGWRPEVSLEEGLAATVEWLAERTDSPRYDAATYTV